MSKIICFHHDDLDGIVSAAIVRKALGKDVELREMRYGMDPTKDVEEESEIYFVDFSPRDMDDLEVLCEKLNCKVHILDHHETAFNKFMGKTISEQMGKNLDLQFDLKKAGCHITWEYFFKDEKMPEIVELIGMYDIWDHSDPRVLPTQYGMMLLEQDPTNDEMWENLLAPQVLEKDENGMAHGLTAHEQIMNMGSIALLYREQQDERAMRKAHMIDFHGVPCIAINDDLVDSYAFDSLTTGLVPEEFDKAEVLLWYYRTAKGNWKYSLRTHHAHEVNVAELATKYPGGGGHPGAAGFMTDELIPEITNSAPSM